MTLVQGDFDMDVKIVASAVLSSGMGMLENVAETYVETREEWAGKDFWHVFTGLAQYCSIVSYHRMLTECELVEVQGIVLPELCEHVPGLTEDLVDRAKRSALNVSD